MITPESWPADPRECHDLLNRLNQQVEDLHAALDQAAKLHDQTVQEHQQTVDELRRQLELYRRYVFGPRRERLVEAPGQGHLFELDEADESLTLPPEPPARDSRPPAQPRRSRKPDYDRLPQVRIEHDVPEAEKLCSQCGEPKARIGEDEARVLQFIPAHFELHVHVLPKYACPHCRDGVVAPEPPPRPVSGCIAGAGLLAQVVVSKFAEHLPLYRFEDISTRYGLYLSRSTLCDWVGKIADLLGPLYELQKELVRQAGVIWTDDTPVTVLGGEKPGSHTGRFWVYIGPAAFPYDVYDFTENRKRDGPRSSWRTTRDICKPTPSAAMTGSTRALMAGSSKWPAGAHARRKFFEARSSSPAEASLILEMIRRLYEVEDRARPLDDAARCAVRQAEAVPILQRLRVSAEITILAGPGSLRGGPVRPRSGGYPMARTPDPKVHALWRDRIRRQEASGLTIDQFCTREGVARSKFHAWKRRLRLADSAGPGSTLPARSTFLPVTVRLLERVADQPLPIEADLPNGIRLRIPTVNEHLACRLVRAVAAAKTNSGGSR